MPLSIALSAVVSASLAAGPHDLDGAIFDAALDGPGGAVRFGIRFEQLTKSDLRAFITNGEEAIAVPKVVLADDALTLDFDYFDSVISARIDDAGSFIGEWKRRRSADEWVTMPFRASPGGVRTMDFQYMPEWVGGRWRVKFEKEAHEAVGVFGGGDRRDLRGTFLTTTGDYRFLAGRADESAIELSCFDGAHAFLFKAALRPDGSLKGDFWSGPSYHDTWTAVKDDSAALPDPFGLTTFTGTAEQLDSLAYTDTGGTLRRIGEWAGKPRLIEVFGTWCPNCRDASHLLVELDKRYRGRGLAVIGLAFEVTGDAERDRRQVALYAERHGIGYPLLIAGRRDKTEASEKFPVIDRLRAYPTFIFIDAAGEVRGVYTGFSGPATGEEHERLKRAFESRIESMLPPR